MGVGVTVSAYVSPELKVCFYSVSVGPAPWQVISVTLWRWFVGAVTTTIPGEVLIAVC